MRLRFAGVLGLLALGLGASLTVSCSRPATQLLVEVDSDLSPDRIACVHAEIISLRDPSIVGERTIFLDPTLAERATYTSLPFSFGVVPPQGDPHERVEVRASAFPLAPCMTESFGGLATVTRRVRTGFVPHSQLDVGVFLSRRCDGVVCDPTSTCDQGSCIPIPEVDPNGGYLDAGPLDAGPLDAPPPSMDAPTDAVDDAGGLSRPLPAMDDFSVAQAQADDAHGRIYPVGVQDEDTILVAGLSTVGIASLGLAVNDAGGIDAGAPADHAAFFLAQLAHGMDGWGTIWIRSFDAAAPYPVVERAIPIADGYVLCGSLGGGFSDGTTNVAGTAPNLGFVLRLDTHGALLDDVVIDVVPPDLTGLDAASADGGFPHPSPRAFCTDIDVRGEDVLVSSQVWAGTGVRLHGSHLSSTSASAGTVFDDHQSLVVTQLSLSTPARLTHVRTTVVGHAEFGNGLYVLGRDGVRAYARHLEGGDVFYAIEGDELAVDGSDAPTGVYDRPWVARTGTSPFDAHALVSAVSPPGMRAHLRAATVSSMGVPWVAITVHVEGFAGVDAGMLDAGMPPLGTVSFQGGLVPDQTISSNTTFLCELDPATGNVFEIVRMPNSVDAGRDDSLLAFADARLEGLPSGALFATGDGYLLHAANVANGEHVADPVHDSTLSVSSAITGGDAGMRLDELDPLMGIVSPSGRTLTWQWAGVPTNLDWRLTHAVATAHYVAVAGYVEDQSFDFGHQWRRQRSFFQIYARDATP